MTIPEEPIAAHRRRNGDRRFKIKSLGLRVAVVILLSPLGVLAQNSSEERLPKLETLAPPSVESLLADKPTAWVVLTNDEVIVTNPIVPRPNTIEALQAQLSRKEAERRQATPETRDQLAKDAENLSYVYVTLPDAKDLSEYRIPLRRVKTIVHYEDQILRRIAMLLQESQIDPALELLARLQQCSDNWPGIKDTTDNILFVDGSKKLREGKAESALAVFDELCRRNGFYSGLEEKMGEAVRKLVDDAIARKDFVQAQYFLVRLKKRFPNHSVYKQFDTQLTQQARDVLETASAAASQKQVREAAIQAELATRIWPLTADLRSPHRTFTERYQRLHVGVLDLPDDCQVYPFPTPADERRRTLTELPLFEVDRVRDGTAYYRTRFFDEWEPINLGREMRFTLRQFRQPFEMQGMTYSSEVVAPILDRLNPDHPAYDERLASFIESVQIDSPTQFRLTFRRVPPRLEPLLAKLSLKIPAADESAIASSIEPGGFRLTERQPAQWTYVRRIPEAEGLSHYKVSEIIEHRYDSPDRAVQAFNRGEVSLLPDLPDWIIRRMQQDQEFLKRTFIQQYAVPETHVLQFNPQSRAARVRELRTALAYGVNQEGLLKNIVLQDPQMQHGRKITAPYFSSSPGRNAVLEPRHYDLATAVAMSLAARKQLNDELPPLTMIVAPGQIPEAAAQEIARVWRLLGFDIRVVTCRDPAPESWDIVYRTLHMSEPTLEIWPFLTCEAKAQISDLTHFPDWLKQELIRLERTIDQSAAMDVLRTLHRHLWEDTACIPLWEIDRFIVFRKYIQGFSQRPVHCYDKVDRWSIEPWFQTELP